MNSVKLVIVNKGDYNRTIKKINNYLGEYDNRYIRLDIKYIKETISDGLDYNKDGMFDKIEKEMIKTILLSGFSVILVAIDKPDSYYKNIEKFINSYSHLINVKIEYKEINKKENWIKRLIKRIKKI